MTSVHKRSWLFTASESSGMVGAIYRVNRSGDETGRAARVLIAGRRFRAPLERAQ